VEIYVHSGYSDPLDQVAVARTAEEVGLDGMTLPDHLFVTAEPGTPYPYTPDGAPPFAPSTPWPDPWVMAGALGTATTRLRFLTNVYILPLRNPLLTAKAGATAAVLTSGRVTLGVGVGWMREEFDALRSPFGRRGRVADEAIGILRTLWSTGAHPEHHSEHFDFPAIVMLPRPPAPIPIFVGGGSEAALDRAARLGDGYLSLPQTLEQTAELVADLERRLRDHGRDPGTFHFHGSLVGWPSYDGLAALAETGVRGTHIRLWRSKETDLLVKQDALKAFAHEVVAPLRELTGAT
jgi:probable F420-dependent oxidoreductase